MCVVGGYDNVSAVLFLRVWQYWLRNGIARHFVLYFSIVVVFLFEFGKYLTRCFLAALPFCLCDFLAFILLSFCSSADQRCSSGS